MKTILLIPFLIFFQFSNSQIEIDEVKKKKENAMPYSGEFMKLPIGVENKIALGLVGEKVTLIDVSIYNIENLDGSSLSRSDKDKFENKTFTIIDFEKDIYPTYTIESETEVYKWSVTSTSEYLFNKYLDEISKKLIDKTYIPLYNTTEIESLNGSEIVIDGSKKYTITDVAYSKLSSYDYGIKVELNSNFSFEYPTESFEQPTYYDGEKNVPNKGWINLKSDYTILKMIEQDLFEKFKSKNPRFIDEIRNQVVKLGMTEQQCRWAWGSPTSSYGSLVGYDEVYDWRGKTLYFKNDKLALIK